MPQKPKASAWKQLNNRGQGLTEYLVLVILIAVGSIGMTRLLGQAVKDRIEDAKVEINKLKIQR